LGLDSGSIWASVWARKPLCLSCVEMTSPVQRLGVTYPNPKPTVLSTTARKRKHSGELINREDMVRVTFNYVSVRHVTAFPLANEIRKQDRDGVESKDRRRSRLNKQFLSTRLRRMSNWRSPLIRCRRSKAFSLLDRRPRDPWYHLPATSALKPSLGKFSSMTIELKFPGGLLRGRKGSWKGFDRGQH
jgi:hypothetical protein